MNSSIPLAFCVTIFGGLPFAHYALARTVDSRSILLASPGALIVAWTLTVGAAGCLGFPLQQVWPYFWTTSTVCVLLGVVVFFRNYRITDLVVFIVPACSTLVVLLPYVVHGLGTFPGSWFWDGGYLANGEAIWRFPRGAAFQTLV